MPSPSLTGMSNFNPLLPRKTGEPFIYRAEYYMSKVSIHSCPVKQENTGVEVPNCARVKFQSTLAP